MVKDSIAHRHELCRLDTWLRWHVNIMRGSVLSYCSQVKAETVRRQVTDKKISFLFKASKDLKSRYRDKSPHIHDAQIFVVPTIYFPSPSRSTIPEHQLCPIRSLFSSRHSEYVPYHPISHSPNMQRHVQGILVSPRSYTYSIIHFSQTLLLSPCPSPFLPSIHVDSIAHVVISEVRIGPGASSNADSILFKFPFQRIQPKMSTTKKRAAQLKRDS